MKLDSNEERLHFLEYPLLLLYTNATIDPEWPSNPTM